MSNVEFEVDKMQYGTKPGASSNNSFRSSNNDSKMISWLMKKGIVKSPEIGHLFLIVLIIVNIVITFVVVKYFLL